MTDEYFEPDKYYKDLEDKEYARDKGLYQKKYEDLLESVKDLYDSLEDQIVRMHNKNYLHFGCIQLQVGTIAFD